MSDPFDDDEFFDNIDLEQLEAVEAKAIVSSQIPRHGRQSDQAKLLPPHQRVSQKYHHTVAAPRTAPVTAGTSNAIKAYEPRPLNTEPRAGGLGPGTFGFGDGGKHHVGGNAQRVIESAKERRKYWNLHPEDRVEEDDYPEVMLDASGQYGLVPPRNNNIMEVDDTEVVDNHLPGANAESLGFKAAIAYNDSNVNGVRNNLAANSRREDMAGDKYALGQTGAAVHHVTDGPLTGRDAVMHNRGTQSVAGPSRLPMAPTRTLSRASSLGAQVHSRLTGAKNLSVAPINSQGSHSSGSQAPASQGAHARRIALQLEDEKRKRGALEEQLRAAQAELENVKSIKGKGKASAHWADDLEVDIEPGEDPHSKLQNLQADLWKAQGEAANIRRHQKEDEARHVEEAARLKQRIADMERKLLERDREAAAKVESVKSQAVFATHAAFNSVQRSRARLESQRAESPGPNTMNGSPRRRKHQESIQAQQLQLTPTKSANRGKGKTAMLPPPPKFSGFSNAFESSPGRAKRARTSMETPGPEGYIDRTVVEDGVDGGDIAMELQPGRGTPMRGLSLSPVKHDAGNLREDMEVETSEDTRWTTNSREDEKAQLIHHILNHVSLPILVLPHRAGVPAQPTVSRILQYNPVENAAEFANHCSQILRACGDAFISLEELVIEVSNAFTQILAIIIAQFAADKARTDEVAVLSGTLDIFAKTLMLFPELFHGVGPGVTGILAKCVSAVLCPAAIERLKQRGNLDESITDAWTEAAGLPYVAILSGHFVELCESICWMTANAWTNTDLIDIIIGLSDPSQHPVTVRRAIDLFQLSSCQSENFRPLMAESHHAIDLKAPKVRWDTPILERMCRYLIKPHAEHTGVQILEASIQIVQAISMLSISDPDAIVLISERSILVPALLIVLQRESSKIWGLHTTRYPVYDALELISPTLILLHHLTYPSPLQLPHRSLTINSQSDVQSDSQRTRQRLQAQAVTPDFEEELSREAPQGVNLPAKLASASALKEFNGLQHIFVSALGSMAYADADLDVMLAEEFDRADWELQLKELDGSALDTDLKKLELQRRRTKHRALDLRSIQYLSQDLLEAVIEGPEGDAVYELYVADEEEDGQPRKETGDTETMEEQSEETAQRQTKGKGRGSVHMRTVEEDEEAYAYAAMRNEDD